MIEGGEKSGNRMISHFMRYLVERWCEKRKISIRANKCKFYELVVQQETRSLGWFVNANSVLYSYCGVALDLLCQKISSFDPPSLETHIFRRRPWEEARGQGASATPWKWSTVCRPPVPSFPRILWRGCCLWCLLVYLYIGKTFY